MIEQSSELKMSEDEWRAHVLNALSAGQLNFDIHKKAIEENTKLTQEIAKSTSEMLAAFKVVKTGVTIMTIIGKIATWILPILAVVYFFKTGKLPTHEG